MQLRDSTNAYRHAEMKTLMLVTYVGRPDRNALLRQEAADERPRVLLFEDALCCDILERSHRQTLPMAKVTPSALLFGSLGQVLRAYARRRRYDTVLTWGERLTLPFALLLKLTGSRTRHIALMGWVSPPKKALFLRLVHSHIDQIITWSSVQRDIAVDRLGIPAARITLVRHPVDQRFWRPIPGSADMICAVGNEMRDYGTLVRAMRGLTIRCHIAARDVPAGASPKLATIASILAEGPLPPNVTIGAKSSLDLRALYAQSRFVVIPLRPTDSDNGVSVLLEAMAMAKAVICSRTQGQVDVIEEGVTGLFVPQGNPEALREAIQYLAAHPEVAERMGKAGRKRVEERHTLDEFVETVKDVVERVIASG